MVRRRYIDANVILRYLTNEPADMAERASVLFDDVAAGQTTIIVEDIVLAEVVWTLRSYYHVEKPDIADQLASLIADVHVQNLDKPALALALSIYRQHNLGFADALLAARALTHGDAELISFDRGIDRVPGITRVEPV